MMNYIFMINSFYEMSKCRDNKSDFLFMMFYFVKGIDRFIK